MAVQKNDGGSHFDDVKSIVAVTRYRPSISKCIAGGSALHGCSFVAYTLSTLAPVLQENCTSRVSRKWILAAARGPGNSSLHSKALEFSVIQADPTLSLSIKVPSSYASNSS